MKGSDRIRILLCLLLVLVLAAGVLSGCSLFGEKDLNEPGSDTGTENVSDAAGNEADGDTSSYLIAIEDEPDTVDFQCTTIHYTIAQNVFNRLVEMERDKKGNAVILPSLAQSWEISDDHRTYTFHLREGVAFTNGSKLTSSDVLYTFSRLLTHPDSCNADIVDNIVGAMELKDGKTDHLEGFKVIDDTTFSFTLEMPFEAFLACLSMPGASILDAETTKQAGERFGKEAEWTIGTGSFILQSWEPGKGMILTANRDCWQGPPRCKGLDLRFLTDPEEISQLFENGELDILNLDDVGKDAEFYIHGDIYQDRIYTVQRICITYIALNELVEPLSDVRVRKALQLSLNRAILLDVGFSGNGYVENGIMPHGLYGFNPDLPEIPHSPDEAAELLSEAGYPDGFEITFSVSSTSSQAELSMIRAAASMWEEIGVHAKIEVLDDAEFMKLRKSGELACYCATWTADYNDPDNFFYTFYGTRENTRFRSLNYQNEEIMAAVRRARTIPDPAGRVQEYQNLEKTIIQDDAAWIPLYSRQFIYVASERLEGVTWTWNGSVKNKYREMTIKESEAL